MDHASRQDGEHARDDGALAVERDEHVGHLDRRASAPEVAGQSSGTYSFTFWSAGSFAYHSAANTSQKSTVQVKMCNVPRTAHVNAATSFQVASAHHAGRVADVQVLRPGAAGWAWLKTDVTATWVTFTPARKGTYQLRARLRDKAAGKASGFSPASTLKVS
jgi:hypothetical protein